jgi:formate dehydrogenase major subunit
MWDNRYEVAVGKQSDYPYVMTTFRLAEHMQAGAMTRNLPWLVEAQPEMFAEISPQLATKIGVKLGDYVRVKTARNSDGIRVKANITDRLLPIRVNGKDVHVVALPWHWGFKGLSTGPSANEITIDSVDVSANIPEYKTCLCNVVKD